MSNNYPGLEKLPTNCSRLGARNDGPKPDEDAIELVGIDIVMSNDENSPLIKTKVDNNLDGNDVQESIDKNSTTIIDIDAKTIENDDCKQGLILFL